MLFSNIFGEMAHKARKLRIEKASFISK